MYACVCMCVHACVCVVTDELMAFSAVLQDYRLVRIVHCFPEERRQLLEADVNYSLSAENRLKKGSRKRSTC